MLFAPVVGILVERWGGKRLVVTGLVLQAAGLLWLGLLVTSGTPYLDLVPAFVLAGIGMTLFFVPLASLVLGSVPAALEGVASGTNSAFREVGGVLGIAVLGAVFSSSGGYSSAQDYVSGLRPAILVGAAAVLVGTFTALLVPALRRARTGERSLGAHPAETPDPIDDGSTSQDLITSSLGSAA
jgi:MFS family permease